MTEGERRGIEADCTRLINQYVNFNDAQDWDAVAALYTDNAIFKRPSGGDPVVGREAILASFLARPARAQRHVIANIVVDVESVSEARAFSAIVLYQGDPSTDGSLPEQAENSPLIGWFRDRIVLTGNGWRFAERAGGLDFKP